MKSLFVFAIFVQSVLGQSCPADYQALNRVYNPNAPACPQGIVSGLGVGNHCKCTTCDQIDVYMTQDNETCTNGTWSASVDCVGSWGTWSTCNATCGGGQQSRTFEVTVAAQGGSACAHSDGDVETQTCNTVACANCSSYTCPTDYGPNASQNDTECAGSTCGAADRDTCCGLTVDCVGSWGSWSTCNATCGGGTKNRSFTITRDAAYGGAACDDSNSSSTCNEHDCNVKCSSYTCPVGFVPDVSQSDANCAGTTCDDNDRDTCCEAGYKFGIADIELCPDDPDVQIVWAGTHNIQETEGHDCTTNTIGDPLAFTGSTTLGGDVGFLPATSRRNISADKLSSWDSTRYFRCTQHCSGARLRVTCNRTAPAASCDTFTCPSGWENKTNKASLSCAGSTCRARGTNSGEYGYGTAGWGQGEPKLDVHRCCDYGHAKFQYVEHTKDASGNWISHANGGSGCLSDKCHNKSVAYVAANTPYRACVWGSGSCAACDYCTHTVNKTKYTDDRAYCDAHCYKRAVLEALGNAKYDGFCHWSSCRGCTGCVEQRDVGYAEKTGCDANCWKRAELKDAGNVRYNDFCRWSSCRGCTTCATEITNAKSGYSVRSGCDAHCWKRAELKDAGNVRYTDFCRWTSCHRCTACGGTSGSLGSSRQELSHEQVKRDYAGLMSSRQELSHEHVARDYAGLMSSRQELSHEHVERDYAGLMSSRQKLSRGQVERDYAGLSSSMQELPRAQVERDYAALRLYKHHK